MTDPVQRPKLMLFYRKMGLLRQIFKQTKYYREISEEGLSVERKCLNEHSGPTSPFGLEIVNKNDLTRPNHASTIVMNTLHPNPMKGYHDETTEHYLKRICKSVTLTRQFYFKLLMMFEDETHMPNRQICGIAFRLKKTGAVYSLPAPNRHHDLIRSLSENSLVERADILTAEQGFVDQYHYFLSREEAWIIAERAGQIISDVGVEGALYSENIW